MRKKGEFCAFVLQEWPFWPDMPRPAAFRPSCCPGSAKHIRPGSFRPPPRAGQTRRAEKTFFFKKFKNNFKNLLTKFLLRDKIRLVPNGTYALVAQLDRVTDYESVGRGFESLPSHQEKPVHVVCWFFFLSARWKGLEQGGGAQRRKQSPSGALLSLRVPTCRNVYCGSCA